jgi:CheY-like chemotaxis protein
LDDSAMSLELVSAALEQHDIEVHTFNSAFDVSSRFEVIRPAAIVVDLNMPALQGDTVVDILRRNATHRCPVILYSAALEPELRRRAAACGADAFVRKTHDTSPLVRAVLEQVRRGR